MVLQLGKISWFQVWAAVPMLSSILQRSSSCFFLFCASFSSTNMKDEEMILNLKKRKEKHEPHESHETSATWIRPFNPKPFLQYTPLLMGLLSSPPPTTHALHHTQLLFQGSTVAQRVKYLKRKLMYLCVPLERCTPYFEIHSLTHRMKKVGHPSGFRSPLFLAWATISSYCCLCFWASSSGLAGRLL